MGRALSKSQSLQTLTPPRFTEVIFPSPVDYRYCLTEQTAVCNHGDHLVRTLVTSRYSPLYLCTNFVSSAALSSYSVF
jgi:hypothetical protein